MKLERLISIIYKLLNNEVLSASMLAEEYQVSQRTIYRDIDVICAAGFPVISYQGMNGGYGIMDGYKMDKSLLGSYDVDSLITVLSSLSSVFKDERAQIDGTTTNNRTRAADPHCFCRLRNPPVRAGRASTFTYGHYGAENRPF